MRLSEAIREGSKKTYQCFHSFFAFTSLDAGRTGACAIGAAVYDKLKNMRLDETPAEIAERFFPILLVGDIQCPACDLSPDPRQTLRYVVQHLNDYHSWSREAIAEWVETIENKLEPPPEETSLPDANGDGIPDVYWPLSLSK